MGSEDIRPQTPQALRRSLTDKLRAEAQTRGASVEHVRKQYVFALLFKRLFDQEETSWAVLGGNALLLRIGSGRFTDDVDLARVEAWESPRQLLEELVHLTTRDMGDGFTFHFKTAEDRQQLDAYGYGLTSVKVMAEALLDHLVFESFTLDIATQRRVQSPVDYVRALPVIDHPSLNDLPRVPVVSIESHLADKVCALYETHHGGKPSTRYRDLADIVRIVAQLSIDANRLIWTLEAEAARRKITLPPELIPPHKRWAKEFPAAARTFSEFPVKYQSLKAALHFAGVCLNPVLAREIPAGTWDPSKQAWASP